MDQETSQEESGDIRRKAMARLGIAGIVTAVALAALWWLDHSSKQAAKPKTTAPSAIVSAPVQVPAPPPAPQAQPQPVPAPETPPPPENAPAPETAAPPPAPSVSNEPVHAPRPAPAMSTQRPAANTPTAQSATPAKPAPAHSAAAMPSISASGKYAVQVGVFSDPAHAQELVDRLNAAGIHAYVETRVHVGPFASEAQAQKARAVLGKMGIHGLITPAAARK